MSEFLTKSAQNLQSADLLINTHANWSSSIHCSYYACVQLMLHIKDLDSAKFVTFEKKVQAAAKSANKSISSHEILIKYVEGELMRNTLSRSYYQLFTANIWPLKSSRNDADYTLKPIDDVYAGKSLKEAKKVILQLKSAYRII